MRYMTVLATLIMMSIAAPALAQSPIQEAAKTKEERDALRTEVQVLRKENEALKAKLESIEMLPKKEEVVKAEPLKGSGGWGTLKWGEGSKQFKRHIKKAKKLDDAWCLENNHEVLGYKGHFCGYYTPDDKLAQLGWWRTKRYRANDGEADKWATIKVSLTEKYGEPITNSIDWSSTVFEDDIPMAIASGHLSLTTVWQDEDSTITLNMEGSSFNTTLSLVYRSKALESEYAAKLAAEKQSDL